MNVLYNTGIYSLPDDLNLNLLFHNKDDNIFLTTKPNERLYNMFAGNNTLKSMKPMGKRSYRPPVETNGVKHANTVNSDFPRGAGGVPGTVMWADGTYNEMLARVNKSFVSVPNFPVINQRTLIFDEKSVGANTEIVRAIESLKVGLLTEKEAKLREFLQKQGINEEEINKIVAFQGAAELSHSAEAARAGLKNKEAQKAFEAEVARMAQSRLFSDQLAESQARAEEDNAALQIQRIARGAKVRGEMARMEEAARLNAQLKKEGGGGGGGGGGGAGGAGAGAGAGARAPSPPAPKRLKKGEVLQYKSELDAKLSGYKNDVQRRQFVNSQLAKLEIPTKLGTSLKDNTTLLRSKLK